MGRTRWRQVLALALGAALTACVRVRPHERETLSHPALAQPVVPSKESAEGHVYQIREGTGGADGAGGGGCGCN